MSKVIKNLKYSPSHEWVKVIEDGAYIGISDYAQDSLGDVVYIDGGEVGDKLSPSKVFGAIESVKAASDLISPISGQILEINEAVIDSPELINEDCYENWIIKVSLKNPQELDELMDEEEYQKYINE